MKAALVVLLGGADRGHAALGGETPLQRARTPHLDALLAAGRLGRLRATPAGAPPGFETALPALLGVPSPAPAAGPLEALGLDRALRSDETAFLADFITIRDGELVDPTGGRPRPAEADVLRDAVNAALGGEGRLVPASQPCRHLLLLSVEGADRTRCATPHALGGRPVRDAAPEGPAAARLVEIMRRAGAVLADHEVNNVRVDLHENPANGLWVWGGGRTPDLASVSEHVGARVVVVSGPGYVRGLALAAGCETADAGPGEGKAAAAALGALDDGADLAVVVVSGPLAAGLDGDPGRKVAEIERADEGVIGPLLRGLRERGDHRVAVCADHVLASERRRALPDPSPFALAGTGVPVARKTVAFTEEAAAASDLEVGEVGEFLPYVLGR